MVAGAICSSGLGLTPVIGMLTSVGPTLSSCGVTVAALVRKVMAPSGNVGSSGSKISVNFIDSPAKSVIRGKLLEPDFAFWEV